MRSHELEGHPSFHRLRPLPEPADIRLPVRRRSESDRLRLRRGGTRHPGACSSVGLERPPDKREVRGSNPRKPTNFGAGGVAQLVEHLVCNQGVVGSNPVASTGARERVIHR